MITFLHTGDIHLDTPFSAHFERKQMQVLRREIMQTFRKIVLSAAEKDFLFICGDLFDGRFVSSETISFVKRCFSDIPQTEVFIAAGNHDPFVPGSAYAQNDWGENVHIFDTSWEYFDFPEKQARIHGRSFSSEHVEGSMLSPLDLAPDWCNIAVLHGEIVGTGGTSTYNPIEKKMLSDSHVDYVALGHIHQRSLLERTDGVYYAYCGIPSGRGFDEDGEKGYYVGEAEKENVSLTWVPTDGRKFWHVSCDITDAEDRFAVQEMILDAVRKTGTVDDCFKVALQGNVRCGMIDPDFLQDSLAGYAFYIQVIDETKPELLPKDVVGEHSLRGDFITAMMNKIDNMPEEEKAIGTLALELGLNAMERGKVQ